MVSTRGHPTSPLNTGLSNDKKERPRPAPRPPKYPPHLSRAFVADLDDDIIDIGPKATPIVDLHRHYERKVDGGVVFLTREEVMKGRIKERKKKQRRERTGGKSRAARKAAWKRGRGRERGADGRFRVRDE